MSTEPGSARALAHQLARGIDPDALGRDAFGADMARAADMPEPLLLEAGCVRAAYEAIAAAGECADAPDDATFVSLRAGARAAADAARVADEIGAGAALALRAAARAWYPYAVEGESTSWKVGLKAFSETCDVDAEADQNLVVRGVWAAGAAAGRDDTATGRAIRAFADELMGRTTAGEDLLTAWRGAVRHTAEVAPDPVFHTVVDAVQGVLTR
ncbi:hypothetical protein BCE75_110179 [Isoptericola sp. CG 20/1183]|uniref:Uncharacterized protein n=1 Tax=Isoptericola halotolerans TaxID=300560 RepID=A0ABX5EE27_9MICO|nr:MULTISPECIES: hypothetical protein [Isoptericola]PRZ04341.1 hypothetical protein BCL65_1102 [Isoptericola halotolerans]PRZ04761.1 hypothetical protein BCE75_110179 [Isoptericola sp. CG 20/1183]